MSDIDPIQFSPREPRPPENGRWSRSETTAATEPHAITAFNRQELNAIMAVYGRKVAQGEWRDYALDMLRDKAVFSVFRHAAEYPLYRIEKVPKLARKQGAYSVVTTTGLILKRGSDLNRVLSVLDKGMRLVECR